MNTMIVRPLDPDYERKIIKHSEDLERLYEKTEVAND